MLFLVMPHATAPDAIPLPILDNRALAKVHAEDRDRAKRAQAQRLPTDVLAVGTALRGMNFAQAHPAPDADISAPKKILEDALRGVADRKDKDSAISDLLTLRAVQLEAFLHEVDKFETTGEATRELEELGGGFVGRMRAAGWIEDRHVLLSNTQQAVSFKIVWNALTGLESVPAFHPTLDEQRALYTLFLTRPHPGESARFEIDAQRRRASDEAACQRAAADERRATEMWRVEKIKRLGTLDPQYPTAYALGVAYYRAARYDQAVDAFRSFVDAHPDGPYALRAQDHLKAAIAAYGSP